MTLKSEFKNNDQLVDCENRDSAHVSLYANKKGEHVKLIKKALNAWLKGQGATSSLDENNDLFDMRTAGFVTEYKTSKGIYNWKGQIDDVVGRKTVVALDGELPILLAPVIVEGAKFLDVVVAFRGAGRDQPEEELTNADFILKMSALDAYKKVALDNGQRKLLRIGHTVHRFGASAKKVRDLMHKRIDEAIDGFSIGIVSVYGTSAGGRNAMEFCNELVKPGRTAAYVCLADAAFFPQETKTQPDDANPPKTTPIFDFPLTAGRKECYFQLAGNRTEISFSQARRIFSSQMDGKEIHGNLQGCTPHPLEVSTDKTGLEGADDLHIKACGLGATSAQGDIAGILNALAGNAKKQGSP